MILRKILNWIFNIIFVSVCTLSIIILVNHNLTGVSSLFGYSLVQVQSPSMEATGIKPGDTFLIHKENSYSVNDIVAYKSENIIIFHEIIQIDENGNYITKGSSNVVADSYPVKLNQIIGKKLNIDVNWIGNINVKITLLLTTYIISSLFIFKEIKHTWNEIEKENNIN